jgi:hypothetical protein
VARCCGDLDRVTGKVPGKEERAGAHQNDGSTVGRRKQRQTVVFDGGEGAPVVPTEVMKSCSSREARE